MPLTGVRVIDLTRNLPGPYCTMLMADLGADVIVVEDTRAGDPTRMIPPFVEGDGAAHLTLARNKRSVSLDLKSKAGVKAFLRLVGSADVVVEGFRPGVVDRLGIGFEHVRPVNPRLVYCAITGFGQTGPYRTLAGHDVNYLSLSGILDATGPIAGPPVLPAVQIADVGGGALMAAFSIMVALRHAQRTGEGQYLDVSMTDGLVSLMGVHFARILAGGEVPGRGESVLTGRYPCYGVYPAADGFVSVGALEPHFWENLCRLLGRPDLIPMQFATGEDARNTREILSDILRRRTRAEWFALAAPADACVAPVLGMSEVPGDPQAVARGLWVDVQTGRGKSVRQVAHPVWYSKTPPRVDRPAPRLGEHTREVLREVGLTGEAISALLKTGAARQAE